MGTEWIWDESKNILKSSYHTLDQSWGHLANYFCVFWVRLNSYPNQQVIFYDAPFPFAQKFSSAHINIFIKFQVAFHKFFLSLYVDQAFEYIFLYPKQHLLIVFIFYQCAGWKILLG